MEDLPARIDHTVLGPRTTAADVDAAVATATSLGTNVCVPPRFLERATAEMEEGAVVTVVGFPHGTDATATKVAAAEQAAAAGADELDAVIAVGELLAGNEAAVRSELEAVVQATDRPVKAIVCSPLLDREHLDRAARIAADAGCSHAKTATSFNGGGATTTAVSIMAEHLPVKASGGIGGWEQAAEMLDAGAERIGASSGDVIVREWREATGR